MIKRIFAILIFGYVAILQAAAQHQPEVQQQMPGMKVEQVPQTLNTRELTLEQLEQMATTGNPTLKQAEAEIRSTQGRARQAGLYPNPTIGYQGEQIRGGSFGGGEQGAFIQQDIVLGGKLGAARKVVEQEKRQAVAERDEQRLRVTNGVRLAYYQALAAQEAITLRKNLLDLANDAVQTTKQLFNIGQSDQPDVLEAEIESQQAELALITAQQNQQKMWKGLAAVVGNPDLPLAHLAGNLEEIPNIDANEWLQKLLTDSPSIRIAQLAVTRGEAAVSSAKRQPIPDLQLRGGVQQNRELLEPSRNRVGLQGFAEVGIRLPIFNRNQGNIQAAKADLERAQLETRRIQLLLRERLAATVQGYLTARASADRYRNQMIPRAEKAYKLYLEKYNNMTAAYPQVLIAQRTLFQLKANYITALESVWANSIALRGFMLTDALEAPAASGEIDRPVRETNLPTGNTGAQR
jgi:cobalt-zinc-cadmium efflux system outer membrane protein